MSTRSSTAILADARRQVAEAFSPGSATYHAALAGHLEAIVESLCADLARYEPNPAKSSTLVPATHAGVCVEVEIAPNGDDVEAVWLYDIDIAPVLSDEARVELASSACRRLREQRERDEVRGRDEFLAEQAYWAAAQA